MPLTQAQQLIVESYLPLVARRARRFAGELMEFEDAAAYGAIGLCKVAPRFTPDRNFASLAIRAIDCAIMDALRRRMGANGCKLNTASMSEDADFEDARAEFTEAVELRHALRSLPAQEQIVVRLIYMFGRTFSQIAAALEMRESAVSMTHRSAIAMLRTSLSEA